VLKTIRARFTGGILVPLEPVNFAEGDELLVTLQEPESTSVEAEDAGLAQAIVHGLATEPVSKQRVLDALQARDGA
jgi:predicted DNA-binding antitoxin AbrB/MazE fold protein